MPAGTAGTPVRRRRSRRPPDDDRDSRIAAPAAGPRARRCPRAAAPSHEPFLTRALAPFEVLDEEGLALLERNADTILEEVGIDFRDDPDALDDC